MYEFHHDRRAYFDMQIRNAVAAVVPFVEAQFPIVPGLRVLEIGCGEGGVLKAFVDRGCVGVGVEFDQSRLDNAAIWLADDIAAGRLRFVSKDIYDSHPETDLGGTFDIIILKDVIEHIHDQAKLIGWMKTFLNPGGVIFFGFPPWQMPFGGHQQLCRNKWLSKIPYYHLLPMPLYKALLRRAREPWKDLAEIKETGISIERFESIVHQTGYRIAHRKHYLINPIYEYKFGWKTREQFSVLSRIPWLRNFVTTAVFYLITPLQD